MWLAVANLTHPSFVTLGSLSEVQANTHYILAKPI
jgi:hypothetical protein